MHSPSPLQKKLHIFSSDAGLNCYKLFKVDELIMSMVDTRTFDFAAANAALDDIIAQPPLYAWWVQMLAHAMSCAALTPLFFSGSWRDAGAALGLGMLVGLLGALPTRFPAFARLATFLTALVAALLGALLVSFDARFCFGGVVFASVIWSLPGLSLTVAVLELSTKKNLVSGTSRFFGKQL